MGCMRRLAVAEWDPSEAANGVRSCFTTYMSSWLDDDDDARWSEFPLDVQPRPLILLENRCRIEGGFANSRAKEAWFDGAIELGEAPAQLRLYLPAPRDLDRPHQPLFVTAVAADSVPFRCDRGPRQLPALRLTVSELQGSCVILHPDVDVWWPRANEAEGRSVGPATIEGDGVTVHIPAFGGVLTDFHRAEFEEHRTYVIGRAITSIRPVPPGTAIVAVGIRRMVTGRLQAPLGGRVLVTDKGQPMCVEGVTSSD
jgi:hypothetical protein